MPNSPKITGLVCSFFLLFYKGVWYIFFRWIYVEPYLHMYFGQFLKITEVARFFVYFLKFWIDSDKKWSRLHFGQFFHKLIWLPWRYYVLACYYDVCKKKLSLPCKDVIRQIHRRLPDNGIFVENIMIIYLNGYNFWPANFSLSIFTTKCWSHATLPINFPWIRVYTV
jgi:hypothetical protein